MNAILLQNLNSKDQFIQEKTLTHFLQKACDIELKTDLHLQIQASHSESTSKVISLHSFVRLAAACLLITLSVVTIRWNLNPTFDPSIYAEEVFAHPGLSKGANNSSNEAAIRAYQSQQWLAATELFSMITPQSSETLFYTGLAYFYQGNFAMSIEALDQVQYQDNYFQEANFYRALCYYNLGQKEQLSVLLKSTPDDYWKKSEIEQMLKTLK